ncbi:hypothetical protein PAF17_07785 [Paracoccus sp. Z330]|uniref:Uncharacterized protein n=1 Tax=Paracoccus onchidii TaxID=3017813 RepID=A0ABT4ZDH8_9RHOB|nr:hypothetical protein [Paracoccus onchidii]MDB6177412.1 hypothetical protein [Paracoccus onchidii]
MAMTKSGSVMFAASGLLMLAFLINLILGRNATPLLGNAGEMLVLFCAVATFGVGTLQREAMQD